MNTFDDLNKIAIEWLETSDNRETEALRAYIRQMLMDKDATIERLESIVDGRASVDDLAAQQGVKPCGDISNFVIPDAGDFTAEFDADAKDAEIERLRTTLLLALRQLFMADEKEAAGCSASAHSHRLEAQGAIGLALKGVDKEALAGAMYELRAKVQKLIRESEASDGNT